MDLRQWSPVAQQRTGDSKEQCEPSSRSSQRQLKGVGTNLLGGCPIRQHDRVSDKVWLVSFMQYDPGFFDNETGRITSAENPFGAKVLPMCPE